MVEQAKKKEHPKSAMGGKKAMPTNKFSRGILKTMVGEEKAQSAFYSISMNAIPSSNSLMKIKNKTGSQGVIRNAQSLNEIGSFFANRLENIKDKIEKQAEKVEAKKKDGKSGIDAYIVEDTDDEDSDDSFEDAHEEGAKTMMNNEEDPSKLIDLELVNLLRYCH